MKNQNEKAGLTQKLEENVRDLVTTKKADLPEGQRLSGIIDDVKKDFNVHNIAGEFDLTTKSQREKEVGGGEVSKDVFNNMRDPAQKNQTGKGRFSSNEEKDKDNDDEGDNDAYSPLSQFAIVPFYPIQIGRLYFSFTNQSFYLLVTLLFVLYVFSLVTKKGGASQN